ncbi:MAG: hypothetical protein QW279_00435 [Candidatus Jordarchaeaceae archaeon]
MDVETLADMKAYLEEKIEEIKEDLERFKKFLSIVDELLAQESFKTAAEVVEEKEKKKEGEEEVFQIVSKDGVLLGEMFISKDTISVKPNPDFEFNTKSPAKQKKLDEKKVFKFKVKAPDDILQEIVIKNYGDQKRVDELKNTVRWTLEKIHQQQG